MVPRFLDRIYKSATPENAQALYDDWAATYDDEIGENGYATPARVAEALAGHIHDKSTPVLDFGCGTGLSGVALQSAGFSVIDGMDPSPEMLQRAQVKGIYRSLAPIAITDPTPIPQGTYTIIAAAGVIGPGAAPASTLDILMKALPASGLLALSLNDHALAERIYEGAMCQWLDAGAARLLFKNHGAHLPGQNIKSTVYIIEKA